MKVRCPHQSGILHSLEFYTLRRSKGSSGAAAWQATAINAPLNAS